jgi:hypothetical protein
MLNVPDEIKELLHRDSCKKNIRICFPNGERTDICNDLIVKDSVSFKESLCSQDTLKFGLCEAPVFECETVGVSNIKGATISVFCEIFCDSSVTGAIWQIDLQAWVYQIPYGTFIVQSCDRQADMLHRRIVAYGITSEVNWTNDSFEWNKINNVLWSSSISYTPDVFLFLYSLMDEQVLNTSLFDVVSEITPSLTTITVGTYDPESPPPRTGDSMCSFSGYEINVPSTVDMVFIEGLQEDYATKIDRATRSGIITSYSNFFTGVSANKTQITSRFSQHSDAIYDTVRENLAYQGLKTLPFHVYPRMNGNENGLWLYIPVDCHGQYYGQVLSRWEIDDICKNVKVKFLRLKNEYRFLLGLGMTFSTLTAKVNIYGTTKIRYKIDTSKIDALALMNDFLEKCGLFGYIDRTGKLKIINIKEQFDLLPSSSLYPGGSVYPEGVTGGSILPEDYQSCWYNDEYNKPFGAISVVYTNTSNVQSMFVYYLNGFDEGSPLESYKVYDLSRNNIITSYKWTQAQIESICDIIADSLEGVTYTPVEFVGRGLPYVEAGDTFEILTKSNDSITTIVLNRTIKGEITLTDTYKSV